MDSGFWLNEFWKATALPLSPNLTFRLCREAPFGRSAETPDRKGQSTMQSAEGSGSWKGTWGSPGRSIQGTERKLRPEVRKVAAQVTDEPGPECRLPDPCSATLSPPPSMLLSVLENLWNRNSTFCVRSLTGSAAPLTAPLSCWSCRVWAWVCPLLGGGEVGAASPPWVYWPSHLCAPWLCPPRPVSSRVSESSWLCLSPGSKPCV